MEEICKKAGSWVRECSIRGPTPWVWLATVALVERMPTFTLAAVPAKPDVQSKQKLSVLEAIDMTYMTVRRSSGSSA